MTKISTKRTGVYDVERPEQIDLLVSVVRQEIVDGLAVSGPASIGGLASDLGRPADALYYHVRKLERAGLVLALGTRRTSRADEVVYGLPGRILNLRYELKLPERARALGRIAASMSRAASADFTSAARLGAARPDGSRRNLWAARFRARLSPADLAEVNRLLRRLRRLLERPRRAGRGELCSLTWVLSPLESRPLRRRSHPSAGAGVRHASKKEEA